MLKIQKCSIYLGYLITSLWILLYFIAEPSSERREERTRELLQKLKIQVEAFEKAHGRLPNTLAELRKSYSKKWIISPFYDGWSERFHYQVLSKNSYYLKSYGEDRQLNNLGSAQDLSVSRLDSVTKPLASFDPKPSSVINLYPAQLLDAASSFDGSLYAQLMLNPENQHKSLIVRNFDRSEFILTSYHEK